MIKIICESEEINKKNCPKGYEFEDNGVDTAYVKYGSPMSACITYDGSNYVVSYYITDFYKYNRRGHNYYDNGKPINVNSERKFKSLNDATKFIYEMEKYFTKIDKKWNMTPEEQKKFDDIESEWYYDMKAADDAYDDWMYPKDDYSSKYDYDY